MTTHLATEEKHRKYSIKAGRKKKITITFSLKKNSKILIGLLQLLTNLKQNFTGKPKMRKLGFGIGNSSLPERENSRTGTG